MPLSVLQVEADELCLFLEGGGRFAAKHPIQSASTAEKEAQQDRSAPQDARQGKDTQDETRDLGAVADVALRVVPDDVSLVVDLVDELVRGGGGKRSADDGDDGTAAAGEQGVGPALRQRLAARRTWCSPP